MNAQSVLKGRLEDVHFPELLLEISQRRETGILHLTRQKYEKDIYFQDGRIVFAKSNDTDQRLGELLLRRGKITLKQLVDAAAKIVTGTRLGTILVQEGFLKAGDLYQGVIDQVEEIVYSVFEWSEGTFEFHPGALPGKEVITLSISTPDIIHIGIARIWRWSWIGEGVGSLDTEYNLRKEWTSIARKMLVTPALESIIDLLDKPMTLAEILDASRMNSFETCKLIWALRTIGIIEKTPRLMLSLKPEAGAGGTEIETPTPRESVPTEAIPWEPRRLPPVSAQVSSPAPAQEEVAQEAPVQEEVAQEAPVQEEIAQEAPAPEAAGTSGDLAEIPLPSLPLVSEPGAAPTVEISFSDLAEFTEEMPARAPAEEAVVPEASIRKDIAHFNELHRYMFEMLRIEMGTGVGNFLTKILKKAMEKNPLVFEGVRMNEYGELDSEALHASIQGNLVDDYTPAFDWLLAEEHATASAFLDTKRVDAIEAGLQKIRDKHREAR
ncbi:MAG TPA: DUF4388 domain-containing protein [Acidobacteriota bacterium]|nr:DUF4388 domain-containing protein [Acidobacteriota bacterium]